MVEIDQLPLGVPATTSKFPIQNVDNITYHTPLSAIISAIPPVVTGGYPPSPDDAPIPAVHADQTFAGAGFSQGDIDTAYGASFAVTTDNVDWGATKYMVNQSCANGTPMSLTGNYFMGSNDITMPKVITSNKFTIYGYSNLITFAGGTGWTRVRPTTLGESQAQQNTSMYFHHVRLVGSGAGIGFAPAANTNSVFENLFIENFATGAILRTCQNGCIIAMDIRDCNMGVITRTEEGLPGSESGTQSNGTRFYNFRYRHSTDAARAMQWFGSYQGAVHGAQIEGNGSLEYPIYFDAQSLTTVKMFTVEDAHFESTAGFTGAAIKLIMRNGIFRGVALEHDIADTVGALGNNLVMIDGESTILSPGILVSLYDINKWLPAVAGPLAGKFFINDQCRWDIIHWMEDIPVPTWWAGTPVTKITAPDTVTNQPGDMYDFR